MKQSCQFKLFVLPARYIFNMATAEKENVLESLTSGIILLKTHLMVQNPLAENVGKLSAVEALLQKLSHGAMGLYGLISKYVVHHLHLPARS